MAYFFFLDAFFFFAAFLAFFFAAMFNSSIVCSGLRRLSAAPQNAKNMKDMHWELQIGLDIEKGRFCAPCKKPAILLG